MSNAYGLETSPLLASRPRVMATSRGQMEEALEDAYAASKVSVEAAPAPFSATSSQVRLANMRLHYCRYDVDTTITFADMPGFLQFFRLTGKGALGVEGRRLELSASFTGIVAPGSDFQASYGPAYSHLVVQFDEAAMNRQAELAFDKGLGEPVRLPTHQPLDASKLLRLRAVALSLADQFDQPGRESEAVIKHLEQALICSFLFENQSAFPDLLSDQPKAARRGLGRRLEDYIDANWAQPLTVEAIAEACGVSVRSVFASFKEQRGVSPMAYLRTVRLDQAHRRLRCDEGDVSVIDVAMQCGFASFGHFSRRYREQFGELPSMTLARRRG